MKIEIQIEKRHLAYLVFTVAILMAIGYAFAAAPNPGHTWGQIDCSGCIASGNIQDGGVGTADLAGGAVTNAKVSSVAWGKLTGVPAGLSDGDDVGVTGSPSHQSCQIINAQYASKCPAGYYLVEMDRASCGSASSVRPGVGDCWAKCCKPW